MARAEAAVVPAAEVAGASAGAAAVEGVVAAADAAGRRCQSNARAGGSTPAQINFPSEREGFAGRRPEMLAGDRAILPAGRRPSAPPLNARYKQSSLLGF